MGPLIEVVKGTNICSRLSEDVVGLGVIGVKLNIFQKHVVLSPWRELISFLE